MYLVDRDGGEVDGLRVRRQRALDRAEEVLADLRLAEGGHVGVVAVGAAAGFFELDHGYRRGRGVGESSEHVAVEALRAEDDDHVDCEVLVCPIILSITI